MHEVNSKLPVKDFNVNVSLKDNAQPKHFKFRSIPFHYRKGIEDALNEMVSNNMIEPIEYSEWAMPIVPVIKSNGKIRICVDFKYLNSQINVNEYPLPKIDEILTELGECKYFTKLDLKNAYMQLAVDDESQKYLVMSTHMGLFKFKRLPYGIASAPGIFQRFMTQLLMNIPMVKCYYDDILIGGKNKAELEQKVIDVLTILKDRNVSLNKDKCILSQREVLYLGYVLSADGIKPDKTKIEAISNAPIPTNVNALKSFLGLCVYYNRFVPNYSTILTPLYNLTQSNVNFEWNSIHDQAFNTVKEKLVNAKILDTFKPNAKLILEVDASSVGLGAVLKQCLNGKITTIAFASKKLSQAEINYSQIDKEALAIIFGVKKFKDFLLGTRFVINTDHKPLMHLFNPDKNIPTHTNARIQRWALFLSAFQFDINHVFGKNNQVADALSRLPLDSDSEYCNTPGEFVNLIDMISDTPIDFDYVKKCSINDSELSLVKNYVIMGFPNLKDLKPEILPYFNIKEQLTIYDNVLLYKNRVIVPTMLRKDILKYLHDGHKGIFV